MEAVLLAAPLGLHFHKAYYHHTTLKWESITVLGFIYETMEARFLPTVTNKCLPLEKGRGVV